MISFVQFVLLARFLSPQDFGLAAAAAIITLFIALIAEFGFSDAIIQREGLMTEDINLPFYISMGTSVLLSALAIIFSDSIGGWFGAPGLGDVIVALSIIAPLSTLSLFQEAVYKRNLAFRGLALRIVVANLAATCVSVPCAMLGFGVWALVIQTYLAVIIGAAWIWARPMWIPGSALRMSSFRQLTRFGIPMLAMRLLDFGSTRLVELLVVGRYGIRSYGFYAASAKLNQTLMDLLQAALNDVSLTLLSKIAGQRERLAAVYRTSITIASNLVSPIFVLVAALAPEICSLLFDRRWEGIERIAAPLFLLGAVQSLQFFSRPYLSARGRSGIVLMISVAKFVVVVTALTFAPSRSIYELIHYFVIAQLLVAPVSFGLTTRELGVSLASICRDLFPVAAACAAGFASVAASRPWVTTQADGFVAVAAIILGAVFVAAYGCVIFLLGRRQLVSVSTFVSARLAERSLG